MKKLFRALKCILSLVLVSLILSSCSNKLGNLAPDTAEIDSKNELRLPVSNTDSLNPYETENEYNLALSTLLFEGLVRVNEDFTYENVIASEISQNGTSVSVKLDTSYVFSDGDSVRAEDVEYSYNAAKESSNFSKQLSNFDEISVVGNTVSFELKEPDKFAALCLDFPILKMPADEDDKSIIGSGRYKIDGVSYLVFNERWKNEEMPLVKKIRLVNMLDTASGAESVETGTISFYFQKMNNGTYLRKNVKVHETGMTNLVFVGLNSNNEHLKNAEVRQAISLMIPKQTIAEKSYLGYAEVAETPFYPAWKELDGIKTQDKSQAQIEAAELLESAGYSRDNALKDVMRLRIIVNSENAFQISAAENVASSLKSIGINAVIEKVSFDSFLGRLQRGEYEIYIGEIKLQKNMSLKPFLSYGGGASYGIDTSSKLSSMYSDFLAGNVQMQKFIDYFDVAVPFVPVCFRNGIEMYTNEMTAEKFGTVNDSFENIYSWSY